MTVVIPTGARVIDIDLDTVETNVFKNVPYETHEQFYSTDIGMAFLKFTGLEQDYTGCTARLTLINFNDGSKVQRIFEMDTTTTFVYPMLETELAHAGRWIGQLAVIKGGTTISDNPFRFKINGPIMNTALISFDNINTFTSQLTTIYDGLNTFLDVVISDESGRTDAEGLRVVAEGLRATAEALRETKEGIRQSTFEANEIIRDGIVNSLLTAETIAQKVAEKYQLIEAESANRLLSVEQQLGQTDYVEIVKSLTSYKTAKFRRFAANDYGICLDNGAKHTTYNFIKDPTDDFIKIDNIDVGGFTEGFVEKIDATERTGTWVTTAAPNYYTQTVGGGFTCQVKGDIIKFVAYMDNRGGLWEFKIDDVLIKQVSVYSAAVVNPATFVLASGLEYKVHTIVATFKGDDPLNVPSGGAGTSRGWMYYNTGSSQLGSIVAADSHRNNDTTAILSTVSSNKEFAFSVVYGSFADFVPEHNTPVAYKIDEPKFILDNVEVTVANLKTTEWVNFTDFKLVQNVNIITDGATIAKILLTHHIDKTGVLSYYGKLTALLPFTIGLFYPLMLPINQTLMTEILTGNGNSRISTGDETEYILPDSDRTTSICGVSATNRNYIAAARIMNGRKSMRIGATVGKPAYNLKMWQRAIAPKTYFTSMGTKAMATNETYTWGGQIACAEIPNIYDYVK